MPACRAGWTDSTPGSNASSDGLIWLTRDCVVLLRRDGALDAAIGNEPHERHQQVNRNRQPLTDERQRNACRVEHQRNFALEVAAQRLRERRVGPLETD